MNGSTQRWRGSAFFFQNIMFKVFYKAVGCDTNPDPDPLKIHQNRKCKWFRIRTWSGSANHTKLDANATGSGFLNPDSGIFMQTPDSHRIRTIRYRSPPPDLIGLERLLFVRVPGIQIIHEEQGMLCPAAGPCHLSPKPAKYHVTITILR